jgi:hypothetical protein
MADAHPPSYDNEWAKRATALAESELLKGKTLVGARHAYDAAKSFDELERTKSVLIVAIQNGPRYRPAMVTTRFNVDAVLNDPPKIPDAWKAEMIAEVEAEHAAKYPVRMVVYEKRMEFVKRRRRTTGSICVMIIAIAFLIGWRVGLVVGLVLFALGCWVTKFWTE